MTELNRFWVFMTFTASLAALVACGAKKNESPFAVTDSVFVKEGLDQKALADANVRCDGPNDCPEGIALMAVQVTKGRFDLCTAFLVSEDIVATNSHCLQQAQEGSIPGPVEPRRHNIGGKKTPAKPVEVKPTFATPSQCPNIHFFFPKTGSQLQQMVQCHSVVGASKVPLNAKGRDFLNLPDYAFIRLTRSV
ncbi:MAG: trypsin-like serine protease, partial [Bdellovibrionota bacterium]